jgi:YfiH family protein
MIETTLPGTGLPVLQSELLQREAGVVHFFTMRQPREGGDLYGALNLCDYVDDDPAHVADSRRQVTEALGVAADRLWMPRQVHGREVCVVDASTPNGLECDAVVTTEPGLCIGVSTADCVPVLLAAFAEGEKRCLGVAAVHAGWRGTVQHIVRLAAARLIDETDCRPERLLAAVGPSISPEAFEVGEEVAERFREAGFASCVRLGASKPHVDLWQANVEDLMAVGIPLDRIDCTPICTMQNADRLWSARAQGVRSGRMASCILMKP